ncbi:hypothetical protein WDZ92_51435, partial [Nostoc sp. NIES-2111]
WTRGTWRCAGWRRRAAGSGRPGPRAGGRRGARRLGRGSARPPCGRRRRARRLGRAPGGPGPPAARRRGGVVAPEGGPPPARGRRGPRQHHGDAGGLRNDVGARIRHDQQGRECGEQGDRAVHRTLGDLNRLATGTDEDDQDGLVEDVERVDRVGVPHEGDRKHEEEIAIENQEPIGLQPEDKAKIAFPARH